MIGLKPSRLSHSALARFIFAHELGLVTSNQIPFHARAERLKSINQVQMIFDWAADI